MSADRLPFLPGAAALPIASTEGVHLVTAGGDRILDAGGGAIVVNVGHGRREVADAAARALATVDYVIPPFATPQRAELVDRLLDRWLPPALTQVFLANGGSEAVDSALRLVRQHHVAAGRAGRWKVVGLDVSYHGMTLATMAVGGHARRRRGFGPMLLEFPKAPGHQDLRCDADVHDEACGARYAALLEEVIVREGADTVAAVIAEPVVGASGGVLVPPPGWWPQVAEICRRHGVLLVADEVMTGFGRTGRRFGVEHWDVVPDVLVGGKGLGGGYASINGVYTSRAVVEPIAAAGEDFMFFTYGSHSASCAVANEVLRILEDEDLVARAAAMGTVLGAALHEALDGHPNVAQVRGTGLMWGVELVADRAPLRQFEASSRVAGKVTAEGIRRGVFYYPGGGGSPEDVVMLGPPFTISEQHVEQMVAVLAASIDAVVAGAR